MTETPIGTQDRDSGESAALHLWDALHDADLVRVSTDLMERSVTLDLRNEHLRKFAKIAESVSWRLVVRAASKIMVCTWEAWPGPSPEMRGLSYSEQKAAVSEYQAKGRTVSMAWNEFESVVNTHGIWMKDATLFRQGSLSVLSAHGNDHETGTFYEFNLAGAELECRRSDGGQTTLEELLQLGKAYWLAFSKHAV